jgi:hypothetical protein
MTASKQPAPARRSATYLIEAFETPRTSIEASEYEIATSGASGPARSFVEIDPPPGYVLHGWRTVNETSRDEYLEGRAIFLWRRIDEEVPDDGED